MEYQGRAGDEGLPDYCVIDGGAKDVDGKIKESPVFTARDAKWLLARGIAPYAVAR